MTVYKKEDYANYRLQRAKETLLEIEILILNELWHTTVNRMYYACFYAVAALLVVNDIETSSHSGSRQKFGQLFILTGKLDRRHSKHFSELFEKRQKGDYDDFYNFDKETVLRLYQPTIDFIAAIDKLIL